MVADQKNKNRDSRSALRRLIIVLVVAVCVVIYSYGWEVTNISLEPTQEQTRQDSVTRALRELLSPNIFTQSVQNEAFTTGFVYGCEGETGDVTDSTGTYIALSPPCGMRGDTIVVEGYGFLPNTDISIYWIPDAGQPRTIGQGLTDSTGHFRSEVTVPGLRTTQVGSPATVEVQTVVPVGAPRLSQTTHLVIEKMIETIFLALMATTIALPIAVVLSFLAAHNLMKPIRMPTGKALIGLAVLPLAWIVGERVLGPVATLAVDMGKGDFTGLALSASLLIVGSVVASQQGRRQRLDLDPEPSALRAMLLAIGVLLIGVLALAVIGGISVSLGDAMIRMDFALANYLGNFINTIGRLIELTIVPVSGLVVGVFVSNQVMRLSTPLLRRLGPAGSHVVGAVLGAVGGALIMVGSALIAAQAALMTLLLPLVAALLAGYIPVMIYDRALDKVNPLNRTAQDEVIRFVLRYATMAVVFVLTLSIFNVARAVVQGRLLGEEAMVPLAALLGAVLGGAVAGLAGVQTNMPLGMLVYNVTRTILNMLRSIEPLIMGIVFVIWVGIGPFAGVLALTLHSIASLGKLYSEQIENIDEGPIEALQSTGANRLQTIIYAVVPQIVPPYIAFTLYRWDINVRMSTIIGFVGGGGIGFLLQQQINLLRYRDAGVAVLAIAIVVSILDYASASIRERMM